MVSDGSYKSWYGVLTWNQEPYWYHAHPVARRRARRLAMHRAAQDAAAHGCEHWVIFDRDERLLAEGWNDLRREPTTSRDPDHGFRATESTSS